MKATQFIKYFYLLAAIFLFNACQEDDLNEPHGVKITFQAVSGLKSSADTLLLQEAYIGIGAIDLKRAGENDSATIEKIVYNGPYVVDLIAGTSSPAIRWIFAEPGYYREIEVATHKSLPQGNTIVLKGTLMPADGAEEIPFEFITSRLLTLNIKNSTGITIREGEDVDLLVMFDLSDLFREIDLNALEKNEQGVVVISEEHGTSAVASLLNSFEAFGSFGINNGIPFREPENENPGNELPDEDEDTQGENDDDSDQDQGSDDSNNENPDEDNDSENDSPGDNADDGQDEGSAGDDTGDTGSNGGGSSGEDENGGSVDDDGNGGSGNDEGDDAGDGNGGTPGNDDEDNSGNDDDGIPGNDSDDEGTGTDPGNNDDEEGSDNDGQDDDEGDDDTSNDDDDPDDDDWEEGDDPDDDDRDDEGEDDDSGEDNNDNSNKDKDKNKNKGDRGKGKNAIIESGQ